MNEIIKSFLLSFVMIGAFFCGLIGMEGKNYLSCERISGFSTSFGECWNSFKCEHCPQDGVCVFDEDFYKNYKHIKSDCFNEAIQSKNLHMIKALICYWEDRAIIDKRDKNYYLHKFLNTDFYDIEIPSNLFIKGYFNEVFKFIVGYFVAVKESVDSKAPLHLAIETNFYGAFKLIVEYFVAANESISLDDQQMSIEFARKNNDEELIKSLESLPVILESYSKEDSLGGTSSGSDE